MPDEVHLLNSVNIDIVSPIFLNEFGSGEMVQRVNAETRRLRRDRPETGSNLDADPVSFDAFEDLLLTRQGGLRTPGSRLISAGSL